MNVTDAKLQDEAARLAALHRYEVLDTPTEAAFERVTGLVKTVLNVPICAVSLIDRDRQWFKSCVGLSVRETGRDVAFCSHTIMKRDPLYVPDARLDPRFAENPLVTGEPHIRSYLGIPLSTPDGYNVGSLCAIDVEPRSYRPEEVEILKSFAALVVDELELRRIAQTDYLTGAVSRRSFLLEMEKMLSRFRRTGRNASLLFMDVDHFKRVNDTHGHAMGDVVLKQVAQELTGLLRRSDTLGRLGGEEFGILLESASLHQAFEIADRLRSRLEATPVQLEPLVSITASFGVAALAAETGTVKEWLEAADQALYEAKRTGRNRCCVAGGVETGTSIVRG